VLFLVCRLSTLRRTLEALEPLKDLADSESAKRTLSKGQQPWTGGAQTERYLKKWIEIFREQSFNIVSMYKSIFPSALPTPGSVAEATSPGPTSPKLPNIPSMTDLGRSSSDNQPPEDDVLGKMPSALATFTPHLVDLLTTTLQIYLPNVSERSSRDSLLTQVLYCAGSLGRQGADFGMMLALLEDHLQDAQEVAEQKPQEDAEWVQVMKKHRVQAGRLELLASGVGSGRKGSAATGTEIRSPAG
jgi:hypothetical protein